MSVTLQHVSPDPLHCPKCRASAFNLFTLSDSPERVVKAECVTCGAVSVLELVEPVVSVSPEMTRITWYPGEALGGLLGSRDKARKEGRSAFLNGKSITDNPLPKIGIEHRDWANGYVEMQVLHGAFPIGTRCHAARDGECRWAECPQLCDGEPEKSSRHCPLDRHEDED